MGRVASIITFAGVLLAACGAVYGMDIADAKRLPDNSSVSLPAKVVTYAATDFFYIEEDSRCMGIRVEKTAHGLTVGMRADVAGIMKTKTSRERYILASGAAQTPAPNAYGTVAPVGMNNMVLGGGNWHVVGTGGQFGVAETIGLNNIGLLVKTWGKYQQVNATSFTLDDGTGYFIKCTVPAGTFLYSGWQYVVVTGISSLYELGQYPYPTVYPPVILVCDIQTVPGETVSGPNTPSGNTSPAGTVSYTYSTSASTCNWGHTVESSFNWGDGTSSAWSISTSASHSWIAAGTYALTVTARCQVHTSVAATSAGLAINVPAEVVSVPGTPTGNTSPIVNVSNTYSTTGSTCNWGHAVEVQLQLG